MQVMEFSPGSVEFPEPVVGSVFYRSTRLGLCAVSVVVGGGVWCQVGGTGMRPAHSHPAIPDG